MAITRGSSPCSGTLPHLLDSWNRDARCSRYDTGRSPDAPLHVPYGLTRTGRRLKKQALANISTRPKLLAKSHAGGLDAEHF
jgi:hypothetical protein